jgi:hypothetical protein
VTKQPDVLVSKVQKYCTATKPLVHNADVRNPEEKYFVYPMRGGAWDDDWQMTVSEHPTVPNAYTVSLNHEEDCLIDMRGVYHDDVTSAEKLRRWVEEMESVTL